MEIERNSACQTLMRIAISSGIGILCLIYVLSSSRSDLSETNGAQLLGAAGSNGSAQCEERGGSAMLVASVPGVGTAAAGTSMGVAFHLNLGILGPVAHLTAQYSSGGLN